MEKHEEIDLVQLLGRLWRRRILIVEVAGAAILLGLVIALTSEVRYTAKSVIVPQTGDNASGGNLQGLAAMAGINLGSAAQGENLSPTIYPMVVGSVPFQKDLMYSVVITDEETGGPTTLLNYLAGRRRFSLGELPGRILGAIRGKRPAPPPESPPEGVISLTPAEEECRRRLSGLISVSVVEKNGYITLSATMPQPLAAARVAARAQELLQEHITRFKVQKVQAYLDFVEARYAEVKADFETAQRALARFRDANRDISSSVAGTRENTLRSEYELAFSIYSEMARVREQASIKVKEDTPTFTVIEPVIVPGEKSAPRRALIMIVSLLLGLCVGAGLALLPPLKDLLKKS